MSVKPYPNDEDLQALADAHQYLATSGIVAGASGYDVDTLAKAIYAHGWAYQIDRAAGVLGYRVGLRPQTGSALQPLVSAVGWEPAVALAFVLAEALVRRAQLAGQPLRAMAASETVTVTK